MSAEHGADKLGILEDALLRTGGILTISDTAMIAGVGIDEARHLLGRLLELYRADTRVDEKGSVILRFALPLRAHARYSAVEMWQRFRTPAGRWIIWFGRALVALVVTVAFGWVLMLLHVVSLRMLVLLLRRIASFLHSNAGTLTPTDIVLLSGCSFDEAEPRLVRIVTQLGGHIGVAENGTVVGEFATFVDDAATDIGHGHVRWKEQRREHRNFLKNLLGSIARRHDHRLRCEEIAAAVPTGFSRLFRSVIMERLVTRALHQWEGEIGFDHDGHRVYEFPRIARELAATADERNIEQKPMGWSK